jgi:hypothetical protein
VKESSYVPNLSDMLRYGDEMIATPCLLVVVVVLWKVP